jgi:hypothetical protein
MGGDPHTDAGNWADKPAGDKPEETKEDVVAKLRGTNIELPVTETTLSDDGTVSSTVKKTITVNVFDVVKLMYQAQIAVEAVENDDDEVIETTLRQELGLPPRED